MVMGKNSPDMMESNLIHNHNDFNKINEFISNLEIKLRLTDMHSCTELSKAQRPYFIHNDTKDFFEAGSWIEISAKDDKELKENLYKLREYVKESKMTLHNMYDAIDSIYTTLHYELSSQGVDDESIHNIMDAMLESMNHYIKWKLRKKKENKDEAVCNV